MLESRFLLAERGAPRCNSRKPAMMPTWRVTGRRVLGAFQEVQDEITTLIILIQAQQSQQQAVDAARRTLDISTSRYSGGLVSYLDVVTAQRDLLTNEQQLAVIRGQRLVSSVLLVKALGGGWDASSLAAVQVRPKPKDIVTP